MRRRVTTAVALLAATLVVIGSTSPVPIFLVALAIGAMGVYELAGMFKFKRVLPVLTLAGLALPFYSVYIGRSRIFAEMLVPATILFIVGVLTIGISAKREKVSSSIIDLGGLWIAMPVLALLALHHLPIGLKPNSSWLWASPVLLALVPVWAGDTGAYFVGKAFGKHPLSKHSPNKTVEGAVAYFVLAVLAAWGIGSWLKGALPDYPYIGALPVSLSCGVVVGIFGQAGDLFESFLKRRAGVKDSGTLLPGHGGLLDRIDGVLFAAVPVALVVYFLPILIKAHDGHKSRGVEKDIRVDPSSARIINSD